jgi:DNA modification methylase
MRTSQIQLPKLRQVRLSRSSFRRLSKAHARASAVLIDELDRPAKPSARPTVLPDLIDSGLLGALVDWHGLPDAHAAATALGLIAVDLVVWAKPNPGDGGLFRSGHELLPLFKKGTASPTHNNPDAKRGARRSNLWTTPGKISRGSSPRRKRQEGSAAKPTTMLAKALMDLTDRGEIILDPFLGAGSTLIAAQNTGRVCCGAQLDPRYVDVIIRRYQASTGIAAILPMSGETFEQVAARRLDDQPR